MSHRQQPWAACGWSLRGQTVRFQTLLELAKPEPFETVLDYGCGTGRLAEFAPSSCRYIGWDPCPAMRDRARRDHPHAAIADEPPCDQADVVVACGPWNLPQDIDPGDALRELAHLFHTATRRVLVASLYRGHDERCNRYDPSEVAEVADRLTYGGRWLVRTDHLDNDIAVAVWA